MALKQVLVGDTFKATWIASNTDPSVITHAIRNGADTIVSSGAGVNSLNGHFYRNVAGGVSTPGYYVSEWKATIGGLPYKRRLRFQAILSETD